MSGMKDPKGAVANMRENCKRNLPWFIGRRAVDEAIIPVCGGPSLRSRIKHIKTRQRNGGRIVACNGVAKLLRENAIIPDIITFVDPSPVVAGFIDEKLESPIYLIGSICHPSVLDKLEGRKVVLWHPDIEEPEQKDILDAYPLKPSVLIGGGNTIGLRMLNFGYLLGFREFHFYGLDSSYAYDGDHAYTKHDGPEDGQVLEAMFNGKHYRGSSWMIAQAGQFLDIQYPNFARLGCRIFVHGEGLIPDMCKALHKVERLAA